MFRVESHPPFTRIRMAKSLLGWPLHEVSAYRLGDLLVDSGPPPTAGRLVEWCREAGERGGISRVVLTHHHEDHSGGAAALQRELGLPIYAPESAVPILAEGLRMPLYRRLVWGSPERLRPDRPLSPSLPFSPSRGQEDAPGHLRPDRPLSPSLPFSPSGGKGDAPAQPGGSRTGREDVVVARVEGEELAFRVVPTPGHAFTHVCLWQPERRWVFSGDLYVHERVKYLRRIEDVREHVDSLRRILALGPELLICSHAGLVPDAVGAIERKIAWWEDLAGRARELRERGWSSRRITRRLLGREGFLFYASFGDFAKRNLVRSLLRSDRPGRRRASAADTAGRG